jgi:SAM-dependent methyltransferase
MDAALAEIDRGNICAGMARLVGRLTQARRAMTRPDWLVFVEERVRTHRVREVTHQDPFTYRAFSRPRGYAGDAVMMDYIYGHRPAGLDSGSMVAQRLFAYCTSTAAPAAVRFRRQLLADAIDGDAARARRAIDVVAVAAGHLREVELSTAARHGQAAITAFDQDEESLERVKRDYGSLGVETRLGTVRNIITGRTSLPASDLCYSAGLFDYLPDAAAARLTAKMLASVRPGGTVLIANFLPDIPDVGYMEGLMDWHLIYRSDRQMLDLLSSASSGEVGDIEQFHDPFDNVTFLRVTRAV